MQTPCDYISCYRARKCLKGKKELCGHEAPKNPYSIMLNNIKYTFEDQDAYLRWKKRRLKAS